MMYSEKIQIEKMSLKRQELLAWHEDSWNEKKEEYAEQFPIEIDSLANDIFGNILLWRNLLPFEFIIEELTKLGQAPCLLYDDNGNFAISGEGVQSVSFDPADMDICHFIEKARWKATIREALDFYLDDIE